MRGALRNVFDVALTRAMKVQKQQPLGVDLGFVLVLLIFRLLLTHSI